MASLMDGRLAVDSVVWTADTKVVLTAVRTDSTDSMKVEWTVYL